MAAMAGFEMGLGGLPAAAFGSITMDGDESRSPEKMEALEADQLYVVWVLAVAMEHRVRRGPSSLRLGGENKDSSSCGCAALELQREEVENEAAEL